MIDDSLDDLDAADAEIREHKHVYLYEHVSLTGAMRCNRCAAYVSGGADDIELHNKLHEQLELVGEAVLVLNSERASTTDVKKSKKGKKS